MYEDRFRGAGGEHLAVGCVQVWPDSSTGWTMPQPTVTYYTTTGEPSHCIGKAHVFECEHEPSCKCGKVQRANPQQITRETP
jgi:hypothetical protein